MRVTVQIVLHTDEDAGTPTVVGEVFSLQRDTVTPDTLGLQLSEAKDLLAAVQDTLVEHQVSTAVAAQVACPHCGRARRHKDQHTIVVRSLFGTLRLPSPRWWHCPCAAAPTRTFRPLTVLLPERTTPELAYLQARFAGLVSYGVSATLLAEVLGYRGFWTGIRRQRPFAQLRALLGCAAWSKRPSYCKSDNRPSTSKNRLCRRIPVQNPLYPGTRGATP